MCSHFTSSTSLERVLAIFLKSDKYTFYALVAIYDRKRNIGLLVANSTEIPKQQISASKTEEDLNLRGKFWNT